MKRAPLLLALAFVLASPLARAQMTCADALAEAQKSFDAGNFSDAVGYLNGACAGGKLSRTMAIQVQTLLARALIYDERPAEARKAVSALLRLEPTFDAGASGRFAALVAEVRREEQTTQVTSVSKTSESLREAPATVVVVTGDEIERRGYLDLEQLLHDLPGFDVNRMNGEIYSNIYQRGYYNKLNDRLLLLIDGVEQNDLSQGTVYLSRQFPLTNIDRVEVIYGPASTMYGANAYTGVISVVTKDAAALVKDNKRFGLTGHVTGGGYGAGAVDVTAAGTDSAGTVSWSVAGRFQDGKERDLSRFDAWDYTYSHLDYASKLHVEGGDPLLHDLACNQPSIYLRCTATTIDLTPAGLEFVRNTSRALIDRYNIGFDDRAKNWGLNAKVQVSNLTLGLQSWRSQEGIGSERGALNWADNTSFTPEETALYLRYTTRLPSAALNVFTRYLQTSIDRKASEFDALRFYGNGEMGVYLLLPQCGYPTCPLPGSIVRVTNGGLSTQIRSEISLAWEESEKRSGVMGVEFVKSTIQTQYDQFVDDELGLIPRQFISDKNYHTDAALWAQGSWKPRRSLRFIAAGRVSHNEINNSVGKSGFGVLFTPRLGVIYAPAGRQLVLKAIYSEAFKDPTDTEKFARSIVADFVRNFVGPNPALRPERVRNAELSAAWEPNERVAAWVSAYEAHYGGVVGWRGCATHRAGCWKRTAIRSGSAEWRPPAATNSPAPASGRITRTPSRYSGSPCPAFHPNPWQPKPCASPTSPPIRSTLALTRIGTS